MKRLLWIVIAALIFSRPCLAGVAYLRNGSTLRYVGTPAVKTDVVVFRLADGALVSVKKTLVDWSKTKLPAPGGETAARGDSAPGARSAGDDGTPDMIIKSTGTESGGAPGAQGGSAAEGVLVSRGGGEWEYIPEGDLEKVLEFLRAEAKLQGEGGASAGASAPPPTPGAAPTDGPAGEVAGSAPNRRLRIEPGAYPEVQWKTTLDTVRTEPATPRVEPEAVAAETNVLASLGPMPWLRPGDSSDAARCLPPPQPAEARPPRAAAPIRFVEVPGAPSLIAKLEAPPLSVSRRSFDLGSLPAPGSIGEASGGSPRPSRPETPIRVVRTRATRSHMATLKVQPLPVSRRSLDLGALPAPASGEASVSGKEPPAVANRTVPAQPPGASAPPPRAETPAVSPEDLAAGLRSEAVLYPQSGDYVSGKTYLRVDVPEQLAPKIASVAFEIDGRAVDTLESYPYRTAWHSVRGQGVRRIRAVVTPRHGEPFELQSVVREVASDDTILVNLIPLNVSVFNPQYLVVKDLEPTDFSLLEDGVPQTIEHFSKERVPMSVVLLIDKSFSMAGPKLEAAKKAALEFIGMLAREDKVGVVAFDDAVSRLRGPMADRDQVRASIEAITSGEGTSLFDAIATGIASLDGESGKKALIVLSDGEDYHSRTEFKDVVDMARRSDVQIYAVGMYGGRLVPGRENDTTHWAAKFLGGESRPAYWTDKLALRGIKFLKDLTSLTGGILYLPKYFYELPFVYRHVLFELQNQYLLGYYSTNRSRDGRWRDIQVNVRGHSFLIRTRKGYYAIPDEG